MITIFEFIQVPAMTVLFYNGGILYIFRNPHVHALRPGVGGYLVEEWGFCVFE